MGESAVLARTAKKSKSAVPTPKLANNSQDRGELFVAQTATCQILKLYGYILLILLLTTWNLFSKTFSQKSGIRDENFRSSRA